LNAAGNDDLQSGEGVTLGRLFTEYPGGVPSRAEEPDAVLVNKIACRLTKKFGQKFSPKKDSILRAADRRAK
jgi:hypothetical protein